MDPRTRPRGTESPSPVLSGVLCAVVVLAAMVAAWDAAWSPAAAAAVSAEHAVSGGEHETPTGAWVEHEAPDPVRVRSDAVDITAEMIPLGKTDEGRLEVPDDAHTAGWWTGRANPGERGPAVIVGHVDSREGPGAFWELPDLEEGDRVTVDREDGTSVHWRVDRVEEHRKDEFPTEAVYGETDEPTLRMVTCSGFFDPEVRSYDHNTIVFFTLDEDQDFVPEHEGTQDGPGDPSGARGLEEAGELVDPATAAPSPEDRRRPATDEAASESLRVLASAVEPVVGEDERAVPIALATLSLLAASGAVGREWARQR